MKTILFQGDSITDAGRNSESETSLGRGYAMLVSSRLAYDFPNEYRFLNRGVAGNRIVALYSRIKRDIINLAPDYMSILIGINDAAWDILQNDGISAEKFEKLYTMLLEEIYEALPNIKIMIFAPFVLHGTLTDSCEDQPDRWERFDAEVKARAEVAKRIAKKFNIPFITLQDKFDNAAKKTDGPAYWSNDGVHPTTAGHELIARVWLEAFNKYFR